jgi:cell division septum initiation protein DivIVA
MDTRKLLEELENVINNASEVPFTNKKMVDKDEVERLIDAINQSLPNELESARRIVADKERIMLDAEKKAEDTVAQAKDYIARITEESELVKQAQERANEVISSANKSADELRTSSVTYATDVLKYVETNMEKRAGQPEKEPPEPHRLQLRRCPPAAGTGTAAGPG